MKTLNVNELVEASKKLADSVGDRAQIILASVSSDIGGLGLKLVLGQNPAVSKEEFENLVVVNMMYLLVATESCGGSAQGVCDKLTAMVEEVMNPPEAENQENINDNLISLRRKVDELKTPNTEPVDVNTEGDENPPVVVEEPIDVEGPNAE